MSQFFNTYEEARALFLERSDHAGFRTTRFRIPYEGASDLFIDLALLKRDPEKLVMHISGVHGIEGYAGSAVQSRILERSFLESGPSLLFVHALNPYGMAFYRRNNGENVDLNRNYTRSWKANVDYRSFDTYLNPQSEWQFFTGFVCAFLARQRLGKSRTVQAVASGQRENPKGLFYMGSQVQKEISLVQGFLRSHFSQVKEVLAIDVHTGLGKFGEELLFVDEDIDSTAMDYFAKVFGRAATSPDPEGGIYENQGRYSDSLREALPQAQMRYVLQEFGTYPDLKVLGAVRRENYEWNRRPPGTLPSDKVREQMLESFCPRSESWRASLLDLGVKRWEQAENALAR